MTQPDPDLIKAREWASSKMRGKLKRDYLTGRYDQMNKLQAYLAGLKAGRAEREEG